MAPLLDIVQEDPELLVINKPAGLVCHPTKGDERSSLVGRVRLHLGRGATQHLINRLDRETSGLVVVAKTHAAARDLRRKWEQGRVRKEYWALVHGHVSSDDGVIDAPLGRDETSPAAIKDRVRDDGRPAETTFEVLGRFEREGAPFSWVEVRPRTGRKHQIRIHLAHLGHPLVGDKIYGGDPTVYLDFIQGRLDAGRWRALLLPFQALHARRLMFEWRGEAMLFAAPPEHWFTDFLGHSAQGDPRYG